MWIVKFHVIFYNNKNVSLTIKIAIYAQNQQKLKSDISIFLLIFPFDVQ